jgi:hypothetical protein
VAFSALICTTLTLTLKIVVFIIFTNLLYLHRSGCLVVVKIRRVLASELNNELLTGKKCDFLIGLASGE